MTMRGISPYGSVPNDLEWIVHVSPNEEDRVAATATVEGIQISTEHWIGGERVASPATFEDVSPIDERVIARVARGGAREADGAVRAAREAFREWAATPPKARARTLHAIGEGIERRVDAKRVALVGHGGVDAALQ